MLPDPRRARVAAPVLLATGALLLTGCGLGGSATPAATSSAPVSTPSASSPGTGGSASASASTSVPAAGAKSPGGCPATSDQVPAGASTAHTDDLDHDGRADELWLADDASSGQPQRLLGVRTASGAVLSTAYTSASPIGTTAVGQRLDGSTSIVLLSDGRQVPLYAVTTDGGPCALVAVQNQQGRQYTFDLGFTGYGSGVTCVPADGSGTTDPDADLALYGLLVTGGETEGDLPGVQRTRIDLSDGGRQARNGPTDAPSELQGIDPEGPQVAAARSVSCGDQGPGTAVTEPQS